MAAIAIYQCRDLSLPVTPGLTSPGISLRLCLNLKSASAMEFFSPLPKSAKGPVGFHVQQAALLTSCVL